MQESTFTSDLPLDTWVHVTMDEDLSLAPEQLSIEVGGVTSPSPILFAEAVGPGKATVMLGISYRGPGGGAVVAFDNVVVRYTQ